MGKTIDNKVNENKPSIKKQFGKIALATTLILGALGITSSLTGCESFAKGVITSEASKKYYHNLDLGGGKYTGEVMYYCKNFFDGGTIVLEGRGTLIYKNGEVYIGDFRNSYQDGYGILYSKEGKILKKGQWRLNNFVGDEQKEIEEDKKEIKEEKK